MASAVSIHPFRLAAALSMALTASGSFPAAAARELPNIVVIATSNHSASVMGCAGDAKARTPNLDKFAATAVRFTRAYCRSPLGAASRQSLLTGLSPAATGVTLFETPLDEGVVTLAERLALLGYSAAAFGDMHFRPNEDHGFEKVLQLGWAQAHLRARGGPAPVDPAIRVMPPWRPFLDPARVWLNADNLPWGVGIEDAPGTLFGGEATGFIQSRRDRPFLLFFAVLEPSPPIFFPVEYAGRRDPAEFDPPAPAPGDPPPPPALRDLTPGDKRGIAAAYYTSVEFMDRNAGLILDALDKLGLAEDTVVIHTSVNGYCLGEHGWFEAANLYEPSVRVPLMIRWPGKSRPGAVSDALVELTDIVPTALEAAKARPAGRLEGASLGPILAGSADRLRDHAVSVLPDAEEAMITDGRHKLIRSAGRRRRADGYGDPASPPPGRWERLYDLQSDPGEMRDLAGDPASAEILRRLRQALLERLIAGFPGENPAPDGTPPDDQLDLLMVPAEAWAEAEAALTREER